MIINFIEIWEMPPSTVICINIRVNLVAMVVIKVSVSIGVLFINAPPLASSIIVLSVGVNPS